MSSFDTKSLNMQGSVTIILMPVSDYTISGVMVIRKVTNRFSYSVS